MNPHTIFTYPLLILESHLDSFGHMNNATYLEVFEEARWDLVTGRGYGLKKIKETGKGPVILEIHLLFSRELRLRSQVTIHTQVASYAKKIGHLNQWITDDRGKVCCEAKFTMGFFDLATRKLIVPTNEWLNAMGAI